MSAMILMLGFMTLVYNQVLADGPKRAAIPENDECGLDALLTEVLGNPGDPNCKGFSPASPSSNDEHPFPRPEDPSNRGRNPCTCVEYYLCNDTNHGLGLIDIRSTAQECSNNLLRCCGKDHILPEPVTPEPRPGPRQKCGVRNVGGVGFRITGGHENEAQYGEFPWMVAVLVHDPARGAAVYQCGGSLIHPRVVLTAAHCVQGKRKLMIRAGEWDTQHNLEPYPHQDRAVQEVILHEDFQPGTLVNDPALLLLEGPVHMDDQNVGLVCLPEPDEKMDGRRCVATGWGKDLFGKEGRYQVLLKRVDLKTVPRDLCQNALRLTRLGHSFELHDSFLCARGEDDTCKGDGGSPLVCEGDDDPPLYTQAGIVAWGIGCHTAVPGVYVNVAAFVPWIHQRLLEHGVSVDD